MFTLHDSSVTLGNNLALCSCTLDLDGGELVALIGANGAGKSTLLRLLGGLVDLSSGTMTCTADGVAYVAQRQDHHRWMPMTVEEVLRMGRYRHRGLFGRFGQSDRLAMDTAAERLDVGDLRKRSFGELSGGQQQRVLIASALASEADVLLLDEPITGLDIPSQQLILDAARHERDQGRLVVLSTHHLDEAAVCDRVLVLASHVIADGPPSTALCAESLIEAFGRRVVQVEGSDHSLPVIMLDDHGHDHGSGGDHHHDHREAG